MLLADNEVACNQQALPRRLPTSQASGLQGLQKFGVDTQLVTQRGFLTSAISESQKVPGLTASTMLIHH